MLIREQINQSTVLHGLLDTGSSSAYRSMSVPVTIYALLDPRSKHVRYVGKTGCKPEKRLTEHIRKSFNGPLTRTRKSRWLRELREAKLEPEMVVLEVTTQEDWAARERYWISHYRVGGADLLNVCDGGEGPASAEEISRSLKGRRPSDETFAGFFRMLADPWRNGRRKAKLALRARAQWERMTDAEKDAFIRAREPQRLESLRSPEVRLKLSKSCKGLMRSVSHRLHLSEATRAYMNSLTEDSLKDRVAKLKAGHQRAMQNPEWHIWRSEATKDQFKSLEVKERHAAGIRNGMSLMSPKARERMLAGLEAGHAPEGREKQRAGVKAYWERRRAEAVP